MKIFIYYKKKANSTVNVEAAADVEAEAGS